MDFLHPDLQDRLMREHHEFRKLMEEHRAADERLNYLQNKLRLTARESIEEVELKKIKLRAKDQIYRIVEDQKRGLNQ